MKPKENDNYRYRCVQWNEDYYIHAFYGQQNCDYLYVSGVCKDANKKLISLINRKEIQLTNSEQLIDQTYVWGYKVPFIYKGNSYYLNELDGSIHKELDNTEVQGWFDTVNN